MESLSIFPYLLPTCDEPVRFFSKSGSRWGESASLCDNGDPESYNIQWIPRTTKDMFIDYKGNKFIKLGLCLEFNGACFTTEMQTPKFDDAENDTENDTDQKTNIDHHYDPVRFDKSHISRTAPFINNNFSFFCKY